MFVNRRSNRKGPSYTQIYVPHDQRVLNPTPIPIRSKEEAYFYIDQLKGRGMWPDSNPLNKNNARLLVFEPTDNSYHLSFYVNGENQRPNTYTSSTQWDKIQVKDYYTNEYLQINDATKKDIFNSNDPYFSRIVYLKDFYFVNMTDSQAQLKYWEVEQGTTSTYTTNVAAHDTRAFSNFNEASITSLKQSGEGYNDIMVLVDSDPDADPQTSILALQCQTNVFRITVKTVLCWTIGTSQL